MEPPDPFPYRNPKANIDSNVIMMNRPTRFERSTQAI